MINLVITRRVNVKDAEEYDPTMYNFSETTLHLVDKKYFMMIRVDQSRPQAWTFFG